MMENGLPPEILGMVGLTIAALATAIYSLINNRTAGDVQVRLDALTNPNRPAEGVSLMTDDDGQSVWQRLLIRLGRSQDADARTNKQRNSLRQTIRHAGFRSPSAIHVVLGIRVVLGLVLPALSAPILLKSDPNRAPATMLFCFVLFAIGFLLPAFIIGRMAKKRQLAIKVALPDVLDLLVLCIESGLGLNAAIARVAEDRAEMKDPLGDELGVLSNELRVGVPRRDALRNVGERTGSDELRSLVAHMIQTERLGGNIGPAIRAQSDGVRAARRFRAEEIANRMPVMMLLPTVMFMPALFIVIFVPVALQAVRILSGG
jgi:tight adherence protein C